MKLPIIPTATTLAVGALFTVFASSARANGFLEDSPWQFQSPAALSSMIQMETLRQDKKGGLLNEQPSTSSGITSTSNTPIGNYTSVTAGNGTTVTLTTNASNSGTQSAAGELNGALH